MVVNAETSLVKSDMLVNMMPDTSRFWMPTLYLR